MELSLQTFLNSKPSLSELVEHVITNKWFMLGAHLKCDINILDEIESTESSNEDRTRKMFQYWLETTPTTSRRQVLEALEKRRVSESNVAEKYKDHLRGLQNLAYITPSVKACQIFQCHCEELNKVLSSPVQLCQRLYSKRCVNEATLDVIESIDGSLHYKKTTLLTALQDAVSTDYTVLENIATVLSSIEETKDIGHQISHKYAELVLCEKSNLSGNRQSQMSCVRNSCSMEEKASDILRNNYSSLCQSLKGPVNVAKLLQGEILSDQVITDVLATRESLSDSKSVLLKAVRSAVRSNHKDLELFVTVLKQFQDTVQVGDILFEEYKKLFPNDNDSIEELECYLKKKRELSSSHATHITEGNVKTGRKILIPRNMSPEFSFIRIEFGAAFYEFRHIISTKIVEPEDMKMLLSDCFPDLQPQLAHKMTTDDILDVLKEKCTIIDVHCLEVIARIFKIEAAQTCVKSYQEKVDAFCQSIPARLCIDQVLEVTKHPSRLSKETAVFILDWDPDEQKLEDIKNLLSKSLNTEVLLERITTGCSIVLTYYCPIRYIGVMISMVFQNIELLKAKGLKKFLLGFSHAKCIWDITMFSYKDIQSQKFTRKASMSFEGEQNEVSLVKQQLPEKKEELLVEKEFVGELEKRLESQYRMSRMKGLEIESLTARKEAIEKNLLLVQRERIGIKNELEFTKEESESRLQQITKLQFNLKEQDKIFSELQKENQLLHKKVLTLKEQLSFKIESSSIIHHKQIQETLESPTAFTDDPLATDSENSLFLSEIEKEIGTVNWGIQSVQLISPSTEQCQDVIAQLKHDHQTIRLVNSSSDVALLLFSAALQQTSVEMLWIHSTPLTQDCILSLSQLLSTNKSLKNLDLSSCSLTLLILNQALIQNSTLTRLDLDDNPLITSAALVPFIASCSSLSHLSLFGTSLISEGVLLLLDSLIANKTLKTLRLDEKHKVTCVSFNRYDLIKHRISFFPHL